VKYDLALYAPGNVELEISYISRARASTFGGFVLDSSHGISKTPGCDLAQRFGIEEVVLLVDSFLRCRDCGVETTPLSI
jgi:hypothetical protein